MEFFERAHVTRKDTSNKIYNKSEEAVKKQLKQMLSAYKKGNNQELKSCADTEHRYDFDDLKSVSEFSEISYVIDTETRKTESSRSLEETQSSIEHSLCYSNDHSPNNSDMTKSNIESTDSYGSGTEFVDEFKSLSSSPNISASDFSSTYDTLSSVGHLEETDISIPSSFETSSGTESDMTDEEAFDPDGALASKILEKLGKKLTPKKRKIIKEHNIPDSKVTKTEKQKPSYTEIQESLPKNEIKNEKKNKKKVSSCEEYPEYKSEVLETRVDVGYRDISTEMMEDPCNDNSILDDSLSSNNSDFISVSAMDMQSQNLSEIIGDYKHPTVRNLPSEKQNIVHSQSVKYAILDEIICEDNAEETSSLVPEIDEELAMEDLTLNTDVPEAEESTTYDDTVQTEDYFEHESSIDVELTSVPIKLYSGRNNYIVVMKHPAELFVHGKVTVTAIGGSVEIFGYTLQDDSINIYAPYCYFAQSIKTGVSRSAFHGLFSQLASEGLTGSEAEEIISTVEEHDAIICLSKLDCPKIDFVDNNFTTTELFSKRSDLTPKLLKKAAENLGCSLYLDQPRNVFTEKSSWDQIVRCGMNDSSRGIICGGKGTGKSTLLRYYINRLLTNGPVLVIDLDPGQAEFTIPGNVSVSVVDSPLIGPNFTHLQKPEKALNIGLINPMDNPYRYISAVKEIITYCHTNEVYKSMPWIVNTMGMCNHMGLKFITYIILEIQPTFVYQIDSKVAKKKFEFELQCHTIKNLYEENKHDSLFRNAKDPYNLDYAFILGANEESLPGSSPHKVNNTFALSPKDERYLNVLAYFSELLKVHAKSILDIVPYEVSIRDLNVGVNVKIPEEALTKVINGKIITLCQLTAADKGKMFTLGDKALLSHGYGLIRGIDFEKELLYILTPVPVEDLNLVNALVYADWMPELRGQEKELPGGTIVPYRTATDFSQRSLMSSPRRRFNPLQLLKATRSS